MGRAVNFDPRALVDGVAHLLWPRRCLVCGDAGEQPGARGHDLCGACAATLPWNTCACALCALPLPSPADACGACLRAKPPLSSTRATFVYGFPVDRLLPRLKLHGGLTAGRLLSGLMAQAFADVPRPDALVPVPLHRARLRLRGYDQALELARPLARMLALPLRDDALRRRKPTTPQSRLDARTRRANLRNAFEIDAQRPLPAHVALFDDVMTTGATLHAAAKALRRGGVQRIDAWICARVP